MMDKPINPIDEFFALCIDLDGSIHPGKVRYALACAYRQGFAEGKDKHRPVVADVPCSVPSPQPVISEAEFEQIKSRVLAGI